MNDKNWSIHIEWAVVMVTMLGGIYTINTQFENRACRMEQKFDDRITREHEEFLAYYKKESERTDRLYEMFYEVVRERNEK